jgi:hypothetical protein
VRIEFSSSRPPGPPVVVPRWQRSYWPGALALIAGLLLYLPPGGLTGLAGWVAALTGGALLGNTVVVRRRQAADATRPPRQWTIDDEELRAGNRLGSVRWRWVQVRDVVEHPEVYLLRQSDNPNSATFDVPRDALTAEQEDEFRAFLAGHGLLPVSSS